jgi:hypothetical protein
MSVNGETGTGWTLKFTGFCGAKATLTIANGAAAISNNISNVTNFEIFIFLLPSPFSAVKYWLLLDLKFSGIIFYYPQEPKT